MKNAIIWWIIAVIFIVFIRRFLSAPMLKEVINCVWLEAYCNEEKCDWVVVPDQENGSDNVLLAPFFAFNNRYLCSIRSLASRPYLLSQIVANVSDNH